MALALLLIAGVPAMAPAAALAADSATPAAAEAEAKSAEALLVRMNHAQNALEYEGTLVYLHGTRLATLHVARRLDDGMPRERLLALTGPVRALARTDQGIACMLPDSAPIMLPVTEADGPTPSAALRSGPVDFDRLRAYYQLEYLGVARIAGRDTDVVGILPRDSYRYGYRFFIDRASGLALKTDLIGEDSLPIEQVMFTNVHIRNEAVQDPGVPAPTRRNPPAEAGFGAEPGAKVATGAATDAEPGQAAGGDWTLTAMPPGFRIMAMERRDEAERDQSGTEQAAQDPETGEPAIGKPANGDRANRKQLLGMAQIVVGDGLASASIYIEPPGERGLNGATQLGAITAVGGPAGEYHATVIGEIPERSARLLLRGLRRTSH
ncbi:MucB/RseB C-terminal domain-containing protein [Thiohalocapsa marina]|nr:MucB/RseB C-terminal domain-containing protein [Thiohalocapsa marina]